MSRDHRNTLTPWIWRVSSAVMAFFLMTGFTLCTALFSDTTITYAQGADHGNLLQNPGFEHGTDGWYAWAGGASTTTTNAHAGKASLQIGPGMGGEAQHITLQPDTIYSLSGWGQTSGSGDYSQITLRVVDGNGSSIDYQMSFSLTDWTRQARTITTPATVSDAIVYIMKNAGSTYFYADDIFVGAGRDVESWPFAANSIWNTPLGSHATYQSAPLNIQPSFVRDENPSVFASATAPRQDAYTRGGTSANDFGGCNLDPTQGSVGSPQGTVQVPDSFTIDDWTRSPNFTPNDASALVQGDGRTITQFEPTARCTTGGAVFGYRATDSDLYGSGIGGGHFGSGLSSIGGEIQQGEMLGPGAIHHPLQLELWMEQNASNNPTFRWPADRADYGAANNYCTQDPCKSNPAAFANVQQGSLLALPPSVTPQSLGITTAPGLKIFYALQNYGGYLVDDTGYYFQSVGMQPGVDNEMQQAYGYGFNTSSSATGDALNWYNDLKTIFDSLQVVTNNSPKSIGGGGTPRVAPAPAFDQPAPPALKRLDRQGWTVTASINTAVAPAMLDNHRSTYWQTNQPQASGQNFVVDMQQPQSISAVSLDATNLAIYKAFPQNYEVDLSNDGTNWTQVYAGTGSGSSVSLATFAEQTARYIRVQLQGGNLNGTNSWAVGEFNAYRSPAHSG